MLADVGRSWPKLADTDRGVPALVGRDGRAEIFSTNCCLVTEMGVTVGGPSAKGK